MLTLTDSPTYHKMLASPFVFHPAGSHYMGCARDDSDFDFIVQYSPEVVEYLLAVGFVSMSENKYPTNIAEKGNAKTHEVYEKKEQEGHVLQVQIAYDAVLRCNVRDVIKMFLAEEHRKADQPSRTYLWGAIADVLMFKADAEVPF